MPSHTMTRYRNGGGGYAEFECGFCQVDYDLLDFDYIEASQASDQGETFKCPNCGKTAPIKDETP